MNYLSDHARIVILEKKLRRLAAIIVADIVDSGRAVRAIGQVVKNTPVNPMKVPEILTTMGLWKNPIDEEVAEKAEAIALKQDLRCSLNRLRNPKELS